MNLEEALKAFKENPISAKALFQMLDSRVGNIDRKIESDRLEITNLEKRIEESKNKIKENKAILEALKVLIND